VQAVKHLRFIGVSAALISAFLLGSALQKYGVFQMSGTKYLKTTEPLLLTAGGEAKYFHILPAGTAMYKDYSFPEGHTRYIVYVNFKGAFAADVIESDKQNLIDPIWAYTIEKDDVQKLLAETPISKDDLVRILKARNITREELAQIVREWRE
jgi:hypothetical protein